MTPGQAVLLAAALATTGATFYLVYLVGRAVRPIRFQRGLLSVVDRAGAVVPTAFAVERPAAKVR